jgi:Arc/MetJ-type ribon-helix-helix transcriptional regulator
MSADPAHTEDQDEQLQEIMRCVRALDTYAPAEIAKLLASPGLKDYARRAIEAVAALQMVYKPQLAIELAPLLAPSQSGVGAHYPDIVTNRIVAEVKYAGPARKVSVSMPEDLTAAVQQRVGRGKFSQYVTEAVTRQLEMDLLDELSALLTSEHGPVPEEYLAEARAAWPDGE